MRWAVAATVTAFPDLPVDVRVARAFGRRPKRAERRCGAGSRTSAVRGGAGPDQQLRRRAQLAARGHEPALSAAQGPPSCSRSRGSCWAHYLTGLRRDRADRRRAATAQAARRLGAAGRRAHGAAVVLRAGLAAAIATANSTPRRVERPQLLRDQIERGPTRRHGAGLAHRTRRDRGPRPRACRDRCAAPTLTRRVDSVRFGWRDVLDRTTRSTRTANRRTLRWRHGKARDVRARSRSAVAP